MATSGINNISTTANPLPAGSLRAPVQTLGQQDFLKLLVTQLSQQDPMNPVKDMEFIGQMAQFTALEQSKMMQQDMATLRASGMLGQTATVKVRDQFDVEIGQDKGVVSQVLIENGVPKLIVNGARFPLEDVVSVETTVAQAPIVLEAPYESSQQPKVGFLPDPVAEEIVELPYQSARQTNIGLLPDAVVDEIGAD